jgi:hypothetical protein
VGRVVIATAELAPMPPSLYRATPAVINSDGHRMRFRRHDGIYRSDVAKTKTKPQVGVDCLPPVGPTQVKGRAGRITPFSSSAMSSGRLFLEGLLASRAPLRFTDTASII